MKVILLQDTPAIGGKFDVKEVKNGYARNFLLPRKMAQVATETALRQLAKKKEILEKKQREKINHLKEIAKKLEELKFAFVLREGEKGEIFGSVSKSEIIKVLKDKGFEEKNWEVKLERPLKTAGEHTVGINLGEGIKTKIEVQITTAR